VGKKQKTENNSGDAALAALGCSLGLGGGRTGGRGAARWAAGVIKAQLIKVKIICLSQKYSRKS
jgi:hypothetical protein